MARKPTHSSKRLSEKAINQILHTLDGWQGPLSWELLLDAVEALLGHRFTRQALYLHERIRIAFGIRKALVAGQVKEQPRGSQGMIAAQERITRLEGAVARLEAENQALKVQFVRWAYNASTRGLDETFLNRPLPVIDREKSKVCLRAKGYRRA